MCSGDDVLIHVDLHLSQWLDCDFPGYKASDLSHLPVSSPISAVTDSQNV